LIFALAVGAASPSRARALGEVAPKPAEYLVRMLPGKVPKLAVTASLPIHGQALAMETTRPGDIPELDAQGWPALVKNLRVADERGRPVGITLLADVPWALLILPVVIVVIDRMVIAREERYLERKFGREYLDYKGTVRRWI